MKVTPSPQSNVVTVSTKAKKAQARAYQWWKAASSQEKCDQVIASAVYLKESQSYRYRQAAIFSRLYGNQSIFNFAGTNTMRMDSPMNLPSDRPTFNLIQSAVDTLVSRISQSRPSPVFLTDDGDYKERNLAKKLNNFILGEFYQAKAYEKASIILRDSLVEGTGCIKIFETPDRKVGLERRLLTELLIDQNDAMYGEPTVLYEMKLIQRDTLMENFPKAKKILAIAESAYPDDSAESNKSIADLVLVVEAWHLRSGQHAKDGKHVIACSSGILVEEDYDKPKFPFVFLHYSPRLLGFWSQGIAEQLMGTQMEINSLLYTISKAIKLVGVPRVFQDMGSKVVNTQHNNDLGVIVNYRGIKPIYETAPCNAPELYEQLQRLINYGYQQCGVSALQASSEKPSGLDSGEAIRTYNDISTDRFAALARRYDNVFVELSYAITDLAKDIAERDGEYQTIYPGKNGTKCVDLPKASLIKNPFVIQVFNQSSLPKDPAGRMQKVTEMIQSGMITIKEGRRLLDYPDLDQVEKLANASEERIYKYLDEIVESNKYTPPDPFMDLELANEIVVQYINLYAGAQLEESKLDSLRTFFTQIQDLKSQAMAGAQPPTAPSPQPTPQALPETPETSPLIPNAPAA